MKPSFVLLCSILVTSSLGAQTKPAWRSATADELKSCVALARPGGERNALKPRCVPPPASSIPMGSSLPAWCLSLQVTRPTANTLTTSSSRRLSRSPTSLLPPGSYVFGWQRTEDGLVVKFYEATTGTERGTATAHRMAAGHPDRVLSSLAPWRSIHSADWAI